MFQLKITGIVEAGLFIKNKWATKIVSMVDPEQKHVSVGEHHIILRMHDVETKASNVIVVPEKHHIEKILEFTKNLTNNDKLLVHCNMGVSGSVSF